MSLRRRSTVHDYASLRLHPDGTRVQANTALGSTHAVTKGGAVQITRLPRRTGHDRQENWVALDAGGTLAIKQRVRADISLPETTEEEQDGKTTRETEVSNETDTIRHLKDKSQRRPRSSSESASEVNVIVNGSDDAVKGYRARKKRRFYDDFSFLSASVASSPTPEMMLKSRLVSNAVALTRNDPVNDDTHSQPVLPVPSSDLLKYIHYFASEYYASCECLYNAPRETRRAHKMRKLEKLRKVSDKENGQCTSEKDELQSENSDDSSGDNDKLEDSGEQMEGATREEISGQPRNSGKRREREKPRRDMYKSFDGTALMAIGMLVQEHVAGLLSAGVPENWLQEMEALEASNTRAAERRMRKQANVKVEQNDDWMTRANSGSRFKSHLDEKRRQNADSDDGANADLTEDA